MFPKGPKVFPFVYYSLAAFLAINFAFAATQGPNGIFRRVQLDADITKAEAERDALLEEHARMANLTRRLSDDYLDLDLLDERAREILGTLRADEIVIR
ncbi:septum formation initiator [Rhodobacter aestuarii]|uniref:Septum formation initiator n=1 Tax=Rhodobacter aestuarii TaxID=453582 RepID=A0A1N7J6U3_9RHOB|nr:MULTISPECIES: septum formation initiator family protein [Rhodobacter]PTV97127.1 septum formation initiator [Rhodobacter aestuarii]SIS44956.1 Septum formation initiator [Rhodobacter aestuarii]SOB98615.1 septum formation initiator [Rhodobacter sp. JA431]